MELCIHLITLLKQWHFVIMRKSLNVYRWNFVLLCIGNALWHMGAYAPAIGKTFQNVKNSKKKLTCTSRYSMWARQVSRKTNIFCGLCKKDKNA